eukprot:SAG22_NODE_116_length_19306_cov_247.696517_10_plen_81_part_00
MGALLRDVVEGQPVDLDVVGVALEPDLEVVDELFELDIVELLLAEMSGRHRAATGSQLADTVASPRWQHATGMGGGRASE